MADVNFRQFVPGGVKSVQSGVGTIPQGSFTVNITISSVDMDKSIVVASQWVNGQSPAGARLFSSTVVQLGTSNSGYTGGTSLSWQVIEYY